MARSPLTLAALATSAVPGLEVSQARTHSHGTHGDFDSALLVQHDGNKLIIRVPASQAAESDQGADLVALGALTAGVRSRLPFDVPRYVGQAPAGGTRAVVFRFLDGDKVDASTLDPETAAEFARAIAAIHSLPTSFVGEAGLPVLNSNDSHNQAGTLIERAIATRNVPAALSERWRAALADSELWQFHTTVINGGVSPDSFLLTDGAVVGVVGWAGLRVDDPARDLHWIRGIDDDIADVVLAEYARARGFADSVYLGLRATLYSELEVARWLVHGHDVHDDAIIADAVTMMDNLVDTVHSDVADPLAPETGPILAVTDVEAMLDSTPGADGSSERPQGLTPVVDEEPER